MCRRQTVGESLLQGDTHETVGAAVNAVDDREAWVQEEEVATLTLRANSARRREACGALEDGEAKHRRYTERDRGTGGLTRSGHRSCKFVVISDIGRSSCSSVSPRARVVRRAASSVPPTTTTRLASSAAFVVACCASLTK